MQLQTSQNELPLFIIKRHESIKYLWTWQQSKINIHSIINKSIHIETDLLSVGFSNPKLPLFTACLPPPPVILREAEGEVAESIIQKITLAL